jgi:benzoate membrane transport protein
MQIFKDFSISAATAGFIAALVGYTSSVAIVFQAANAFAATPAQVSSWMWALGIGMGICCIVPSLLLRKPVMMAWSTPGAAVLAVSAGGFTMADAVGAFMVSAALITIAGATGLFTRIMDRIPISIAAALLAGVLARFALNAFAGATTEPTLVIGMLATYLISKQFTQRYAVPWALVFGMGVCIFTGRMDLHSVNTTWVRPEWVTPAFSISAFLSLALPLFIVTMASQNLPGVAAIRTAGYEMPISRLITFSGVVNFLLAPFGAFALNLAAITAAICMGDGAHADKNKRYVASVSCGVIYLLLGIFGAAVAGLITAFPKAMIIGIAGIALLGTIGQSLHLALNDTASREAALIAFLVTLSGVTLGGIGSAFWGVVAGALALLISRKL